MYTSKTNSAVEKLKAAKSSNFFAAIQPKLTVNAPGDVYEQEADAVAEQVVQSKPLSGGSFFKPLNITAVQRKCAHCEEEEKNAQRKEQNNNATEAPAAVSQYIGGLNNSGAALSGSSRNFFESKMGYDFSNVKIHTDTIAAKSAQSINALAYTTGNSIVFNEGQYQPDTDSGKKLLAHELTHVVQQSRQVSSGSVQRLVRNALVNCPGNPGAAGADVQARALLDNAITHIDNAQNARGVNPADPEVTLVGAAMHRAFRLNAANDANWNDPAPRFGLPLIRRRLQAASNYINSVVFTINCAANGAQHLIPGCAAGTCNPGTEAFSCHNNPTEMVLCPDFFALGPNQRARTYMHEVFHIIFRIIDDWGQPDRRNAHCYAQFVALLNGFNVPAGFRCH